MSMRDAIQGGELVRLLRERLLRENGGGNASPASIINNYGAGGGHDQAPMAGGLMEKMGGAGGISPEDMDYLVDIERNDTVDPVTGAKTGWKKKVHRYATEKKKG